MRSPNIVLSILVLCGLLAAAPMLAGPPETTLTDPRIAAKVPGVGCSGAACPPDCTCYWDKDCGEGGDCTGYGNCTKNGKLDGTCASGLPSFSNVDPEALGNAVDLYMAAYLVPVIATEGRGDVDLIVTAQSVNFGPKNAKIHAEVQTAVHEILDATLGFDFVLPELAACPANDSNSLVYRPMLFGNIRNVPVEAVEYVEAVRAGLQEAIQTQQPAVALAHLEQFWLLHPHYEPFHTGRYYPHGHEGEEQDPAPQQIEAVRLILERLISLL